MANAEGLRQGHPGSLKGAKRQSASRYLHIRAQIPRVFAFGMALRLKEQRLGECPELVIRARIDIERQIQADPAAFAACNLIPLLSATRAALATELGAGTVRLMFPSLDVCLFYGPSSEAASCTLHLDI